MKSKSGTQRRLWPLGTTLLMIAALSSCSLLSDTMSEGSTLAPVHLGDATTAQLQHIGTVEGRGESFYSFNTYPGREYQFTVLMPERDITLMLYEDSGFSVPLEPAVTQIVGETLVYHVDVVAPDSIVYATVRSDAFRGTFYTLQVEDLDLDRNEGSVTLPVDLGDATVISKSWDGFADGYPGSFYEVAVTPGVPYDVTISELDDDTRIRVGSNQTFEEPAEDGIAYVPPTSETLTLTPSFSTLYIQVMAWGSQGVEEFVLTVSRN